MSPIQHTISPDVYQQLSALRDELAVYRTVQCQLMHEQVVALFKESIAEDGNDEQLKARRKGLCPIAGRRNLLGCAHTNANDTFAQLADGVYEMGILKTAKRPSEIIQTLVVQVYLIDHEKGDLEKQMALAKYHQHSEAVVRINAAIQEVISRHATVIGQIEQFRQELMHQLDMAIKKYQCK